MAGATLTFELLKNCLDRNGAAVLIATPERDAGVLNIVYVNPAFAALSGVPAETIVGKHLPLPQPPASPDGIIELLREKLEANQLIEGATDSGVPWSVWAFPDGSEPTHFVAQCSTAVADAGDDRPTQPAALTRHQRDLVNALPTLIAYVDRERRYREVNAAYSKWLGAPPQWLLGRSVEDVLSDEAYQRSRPHIDAALRGERVRFETAVRHKTAGVRPMEVEYLPHRDAYGKVLGFYVLGRDVTDRTLAERDYLTGVYNRRVFEERLAALYAAACRYSRPLSLILVDLDHFKQINDRHGHQAGDQVLQQVAELLRKQVRNADSVSRWGGEEFAILAPETELDQAQLFADKLCRRIRTTPIDRIGHITASLGVSRLRERETQADFVGRVDKALYQAKSQGRDQVVCAV